MNKVLLLALVLLPWLGQAQSFSGDFWGNQLRDHAIDYRQADDDPFVSTMLAVCKSRKSAVKRLGYFEEIEISDASLLSGNLPGRILYHSKRTRTRLRSGIHRRGNMNFVPQKAPLFIYLPGAFGKLMNDQAKRFMADMNKLGYHVATFANPLHKSFVKLKPTYKPGDFFKEAQTLHRAIQKVIKHVEKTGHSNGEVYLTGVSYGAYLAAIITSLDKDDKNLINGGTTLISPPADFGDSIRILDKNIIETRDEFSGMSFSKKYDRYTKICSNHGRKEQIKRWAKGLSIFAGFQENMVDSVKAYRKANGIKDLPLNDHNWKRNLTFQKYFDWYAPELNTAYQSQNAKLLTWVERANVSSKVIRVFAAEDDWLNEPMPWVNYKPENLLTVDKGGHYGFHHLEWFDTLITNLFSIPLAIVGGVIPL